MASRSARNLLAALLVGVAGVGLVGGAAWADEPAPAADPATTPAPLPRKRPAQPAPTPAPTPAPAPSKPADQPTDKPTDKPADKPSDKTPAKPTTPAKPAPKPAPAAPANPTPVKPAKPTGPIPMVKKELVEPGPYVERSRPNELILDTIVQIQGLRWTEAIANPGGGTPALIPRMEEIAFDQAWIVFPLLRQTGTSRMAEDTWKGQFTVGDRIATEEVQIMNGLQSGSRYAKMAIGAGRAKTFTLNFQQRTMAYRVKFLDEQANNVNWPQAGWPPAAASCFSPQMYIDYYPDEQTGMTPANNPDPGVAALVKIWFEDANLASPKDAPPAQVAKYLAGQVIRNFQVANQLLITGRNGTLEGMNVQPIAETIRTGKGSEFDICNLLVACYRHVGLPARLVVGYQKAGSGKTFLTQKGASSQIRPYVEWCLFDENFQPDKASVNWIAVDIVSMRRSSSTPPPLDKPWRFFGTLDDANECFPFAFHLHPPTSVRAYGSPGFWGWMLAPTQPLSATQSIKFTVTSAPVGGNKPKDLDGKD